MVGNSWGLPQMSTVWANAWTHVLELLAQDEIEWYAVVTYESLIMYREAVVRDLLEVVKSGMDRYEHDGRRLTEEKSPRGGGTRRETNDYDGDGPRNHRRRLNYHNDETDLASGEPSKRSSTSYLTPKLKHLVQWKKCLGMPRCQEFLKRITDEVLPHFGYASAKEEDLQRKGTSSVLPLSSSPGPVTVRREFGRVLFSSESAALNKLRNSHGSTAKVVYTEFKPAAGLLSNMRYLVSQQ
ncbi:hypothetical protein ACHAWF_002072 [Thalassiosira exigua]